MSKKSFKSHILTFTKTHTKQEPNATKDKSLTTESLYKMPLSQPLNDTFSFDLLKLASVNIIN